MNQRLGTTKNTIQKELVGASGEIEMVSSVLNMPWDIQGILGRLVIIPWSPEERFGDH